MFHNYVTAIPQSITINLWPLATNIYYVMIIVTGGFSKKYYYYFLEILLIDLELVSLEFKNFYKTHRTSLFSFICSVLTHFLIILYINAVQLFILFHCMLIHRMSLFQFCSLFDNHSVYTFCTFHIISGTKKKTESFNLISNTFCSEI